MDTAVFIRRHINLLKDDKPFSIRDFLSYGPRNAVDQVFHRLVKSGRIIRVARGLFIKETAPKPSILDVALTKAKAFGKRLSIHGSQAAFGLKLWPDPMRGNVTGNEAVYACDGASSSFRFGDMRIRFINASARKRSLGNDISFEHDMRSSNDIRLSNNMTLINGWSNEIKLSAEISLSKDFCLRNNIRLDNGGLAGLVVNALWYLGKAICSEQLIRTARIPFNRHDRQASRELLKVMPAWLANYFIPPAESRELSNSQKWLIVSAYLP